MRSFALSLTALGALLALVLGSSACSETPIDEGTTGGASGSAGASSAGTSGTSGTAPSGGSAGAGATSGAAGTSGSSGGPAGGGGGQGGTGTSGTAGTGGSAGSVPADRGTPAGTCARWNADRANLGEGTWSGSTDSCDPGDISADGRANALRLINLYRWLAGLEPVVTDPDRDRLAQACALMMEANGALSHEPPMDWLCYTADGADGASSSNISGGPGVVSVDRYMIDSGNATTIGHRRWTLSSSLGPIGLGSTGNGASCFQNLRGEGDANKAWMAWPSPGIIPFAVFAPASRTTLDSTGWSIQSDDIDLGSAVVTVTSGGMDRPVTVTQLLGGYGSRYAIRFNPNGWSTAAGQTYAVSVTGIDTPFSYEVSVVDCSM